MNGLLMETNSIKRRSTPDKEISPSVWKYGPKNNNWKNAVNLSIAPCSENRSNHDALKSRISLVLYGFKSPNWQLDAV